MVRHLKYYIQLNSHTIATIVRNTPIVEHVCALLCSCITCKISDRIIDNSTQYQELIPHIPTQTYTYAHTLIHSYTNTHKHTHKHIYINKYIHNILL